MKKLALIFLLLFTMAGMTSPPEASPDVKAGLERALAEFRDVSLKRDVEGIMSFFHPGLYTLMPKEQVKKAMTRAFVEGLAPQIKSMQFQFPGPVRAYSKGHSALIDTVTELAMRRPGDVTPEIDEIMVGLIKKRLGEEVEIRVDEKNNVILVRKKSWLLALNEGSGGWEGSGGREGRGGWKFINKDRVGFFVENNLLSDELKELLP